MRLLLILCCLTIDALPRFATPTTPNRPPTLAFDGAVEVADFGVIALDTVAGEAP